MNPASNISKSRPDFALEARYYTQEAFFTAARDQIFFRTWQFAGHASQLKNPGDYLCFTIFEQDLFLIRTRDAAGGSGALRCFFNVCQHRGHHLLNGQGNRRLITCPYHAWTYALDGQLRAAPNSDQVPGFDTQKICLSEIKLEEFCGFVFVNLDPNAKSMDECYPEVRAAIVKACPDIETRKYAYEHHCNEHCNWLLAVENYNECYHCPVAHKAFANGVIDPGSYDIQPFGAGRCLRHASLATQSEVAWYDVSGSDYCSFYLWPAMSIQIYPGAMVNTYHWRPLAVDNTVVYRGWYSADGEMDADLQKVMELDRDTTFAEDLKLVKSVQRGLNNRGYRPGPLVLDPQGGIRSEHSIASLHQWLHEALA